MTKMIPVIGGALFENVHIGGFGWKSIEPGFYGCLYTCKMNLVSCVIYLSSSVSTFSNIGTCRLIITITFEAKHTFSSAPLHIL